MTFIACKSFMDIFIPGYVIVIIAIRVIHTNYEI
jgi:hypothetical protein